MTHNGKYVGRSNSAQILIIKQLKLTNCLSKTMRSLLYRMCRLRDGWKSLKSAREGWTMTLVLDGHQQAKSMKMWLVARNILNSDRQIIVWFGQRCLLRGYSEEMEVKDYPRTKRHSRYLGAASQQCAQPHVFKCPWGFRKTQRGNAAAATLESQPSSDRLLFIPKDQDWT